MVLLHFRRKELYVRTAFASTVVETKSQSEYLSTVEASKELGIGRTICFRWIRGGKMPAKKLGRNFRIRNETKRVSSRSAGET